MRFQGQLPAHLLCRLGNILPTMNLFTYGTLMFADVWTRVVTGRYRNTPAILTGYRRRAVIGETYPVIVADQPEQTVEGILYCSVTPYDIKRLDTFEGSYYRRCNEAVRLPDGSSVEAGVYVLRDDYAHIMADKDWEPERFRRDDIRRFISSYLGFSAASRRHQ